MSRTHIVSQGDTFESIARRYYGDELQAPRIIDANPGSLVLVNGSFVAIPDQQDAPLNNTPKTTGESEVTLLIDNQRFKFWEEVVINRTIDSFDTVEFTAPFEAERQSFRERFKPFSYKTVNVDIGDTPLFTGTMVGVTPDITPSKKSVSVSCYSKPGVINDCNPPASQFPVEYNGQTLFDIANKLCRPFGVQVISYEGVASLFGQVACDPGKRIFAFLATLAKERGLIMSSDERGRLVFQRSVFAGSPVAILRQGESPLVDVAPSFSPQEYYSSITGLENVKIGTEGSQYTVNNPRLTGVVRPMTFSVKDTEGGDVQGAVEAKAGRMFGNMVSYNVSVCTWRDPRGNLWKPNTTVKLIAPDAMIYSEYEFIIRGVKFKKSKSESAELNLVVPGSFSGAIPEVLPWDE